MEEKYMKNDYTKNYFWIKKDNNGNKRYYFKLKKQFVEVDKDIFNTCFSSYRKQQREIQRDKDVGLISLNALNDYDLEYINVLGITPDYVNAIHINNGVSKILEQIELLNDKRQATYYQSSYDFRKLVSFLKNKNIEVLNGIALISDNLFFITGKN